MANDYASQVVVITGGSSGIGAQLAREITARGGSVVLAARRAQALEEVARGLSGPAETVEADVTVRAHHEAILNRAIARFGHVDVWVNNAGRGISKPLLQLTDDDVDQIVRDNLKSALYGMQVAVPYFRQRKRGVLANVSTMLARAPFAPIRSIYSASKAALNSLTETLRIELAGCPDIHVVTVMPGVVATDFGSNALGGGPDSRTLPGAQPVDECARVIADGLLTRNGDLYTRPDGLKMVLGFIERLGG